MNFSEFFENVLEFSKKCLEIFGIFKKLCFEFFGIFKKSFGIFWNFQKIVWIFSEFSKKCLKMFWNFFATEQSPLPHDGAERPRRHSKKAPTSTFLGSKQRQKLPGSQLQVLRSIKIQKKKIFSDFQRFQDFHRARSAHPLGTPTRPCRTFHRDSPTKKS